MKSSTIRWVIAIGTLSIISILIIQIFWVKRAFDIRETEFNKNVSSALTSVSDEFFKINDTSQPKESPVKQFESNYYLVMVNSPIDVNILDYMLKKEFKQRDVFIDFEYGIYDCDTEKMVYGEYVHNQLISNPIHKSTELPVWGDENYYFGVLFPTKTGYIINNMETWVFSSLLLLVVTGFFGYAMFVILKQNRLSEVQKDFINNMTHEFKTPISTISVSAEVLNNPEIINKPEKLSKYAGIIQSENNRLKKQVDRVLQMAVLDREKINLKYEKVDLHDMIDTIVDTFKIANNGVQIDCKLNAARHTVVGDPLHISNIVYNLIDNSIKYCNESPEIQIATYDDSNGIKMSVTDNGIGIREEFQRKIFRKFYRIPTGNIHDVKGFGLGLNYVSHMLKSHGGKISVKNNLEKGCTFTIFLPYEK